MEMNIHIPQSVEAAIELRMIASIPQQIISPQNSLPITGIQSIYPSHRGLLSQGCHESSRLLQDVERKTTRTRRDRPATHVDGIPTH